MSKNIQMKQKIAAVWTNLFPITLTENVFDNGGVSLTEHLTNGETRLVDIRLFGAVCNGVTADTVAVQAAIDYAATNGGNVFIPYNTVYVEAGLTNPQSVLIIDNSLRNLHIKDTQAEALQNTARIKRNASYSGGTAGWVNSALYLDTTVGVDATSFEWGLTSAIQNYANAGENVAIYGQAVKRGNGITWAGVFEAKDLTGGIGSGLVGIEVDVFANGADTTKRIGVDIVVGKGVPEGLAPTVFAGIRLLPAAENPENGSFINGLFLEGTFVNGLNLDTGSGTAACGILVNGNVTRGVKLANTGTYGVSIEGAVTIGLDFSTATVSGHAIRLKSGQSIAMEETGAVKFKYNFATGNLEFYLGATLVGHLVCQGGADHAI